LALLCPRRDFVWEFRTPTSKRRGAPRLGVRVFGMFVETDWFVAFSIGLKEDLTTKDEYKIEMEKCKREWRRLFYPYSPNLGDDKGDYISNAYVPY
jgi:hypothetical protein